MWASLCPFLSPSLLFFFRHQCISSYPGLPVSVALSVSISRSLSLSLCIFLPAASFTVAVSLPLVLSHLSHPSLPLFPRFLCSYRRFSLCLVIFPWVSLPRSCPVSPRLSRSLPHPSPSASPPPPSLPRRVSPVLIWLGGRAGGRRRPAGGGRGAGAGPGRGGRWVVLKGQLRGGSGGGVGGGGPWARSGCPARGEASAAMPQAASGAAAAAAGAGARAGGAGGPAAARAGR